MTTTCKHCNYTTHWHVNSEQRCSRCDNWLEPFVVGPVEPVPIELPITVIADVNTHPWFEKERINSLPSSTPETKQHRPLDAIAANIRTNAKARKHLLLQLDAASEQIKTLNKMSDKLFEEEQGLRVELNEAVQG